MCTDLDGTRANEHRSRASDRQAIRRRTETSPQWRVSVLAIAGQGVPGVTG